MARIKSFSIVPPGGWKYVQPETGVRFEAHTFEHLAAQVKVHREYKGLATDNLAADIERQLCLRLTTADCRPEPGEVYKPVKDLTAELTATMAFNFSRAVTKFLTSGAELVDKATAERRAAICRGCPLNKPAKLCACSSVYTVVEALVPKDRKLDGISVCMACGCSLQAKANMPNEVIAASLPEEIVLPGWCWQQEARHPLEP